MSDYEVLRSLLVAAGFQEIKVKLTMGTMGLPSAEHHVCSYGALSRYLADEAQQAAANQEAT
ncbi:MAG: hypothetical protein ACOY16_00090 [Chloroflexota bacterium]